MKIIYALFFLLSFHGYTNAQLRVSYPIYLNDHTGIVETGYSKCLLFQNAASCLKSDFSFRLIKQDEVLSNFNFQIGYSRIHMLNQLLGITPELNFGYSSILEREKINHGIIFSGLIKIRFNPKYEPLIGYSYQSNEVNLSKLNHCILIGFKYNFRN